MERNFYQKLVQWKHSTHRKPLVLRGARQVGKTYLLTEFAKREYPDFIYLNFDEEPHFTSFFKENLSPERIIKDLSIYFNKTIQPEKTLIIFDEIQECPEALGSLKYFCEKANGYHVATAGSLLGVKLSQGFPVGKVNFLDLAPLTFFEFLDAVGETSLKNLLLELKEPLAITEIFHDKLTKLLKYYLVIGGMPEVVATWIKEESFLRVREIQREILDAYLLDFAKHAPKEDVIKIMSVWESIPNQLAKENKKFIFSAVRESARAKSYETSIQWLKDAGLIIKAQHLSIPKLPLDAYADKQIFKVFLLDVGLLGAMSKLDPRIVLEGNELFQQFKGSLTENYVALELHHHHFEGIYYWTSEGKAEVDFIISVEHLIYPLEVKSGHSNQKKSLQVYAKKFADEEHSSHMLSMTSLHNFFKARHIVNYPLYAMGIFPQFR